MPTVNRSAIISRVALPLASVTGIRAVYAPAATAGTPGVQRIPDELSTFPCAVLLPGDTDLIPGPNERETLTVAGSVWVTLTPRGERIAELTDFELPIIAAYRSPNVKAVDDSVGSVIFKGFTPIGAEQWLIGVEVPWYLVLRFTVDVKLNRPTTYGPA